MSDEIRLKYRAPGEGTQIKFRDRKQGYVFVTGLGAMGVGGMWFKEDLDHKNYEGYEEAKEAEYKGKKF